MHGFNLVLYLVTGKKRQRILVGLHDLDIARHQQAHKILADAVSLLTIDQDLFHIRGVQIADGTNDQIPLLVNQFGRF